MKIMLLRHGYAGEYYTKKEDLDPKDMSRVLKPEGVAAAKNIAQWMQDQGLSPNAIYASPIKRVNQTAGIIAKVLFGDPRFVITDQNLAMHSPMERVAVARAQDKSCKWPLLIAHADNLPRMKYLNGKDPADSPDPYATCELRIVDLDRDSFEWNELDRVTPSMLLGLGSDYDDTGAIDLYASAQR